MPFDRDKQELLREAGYQEGDVLTTAAYSDGTNQDTTSDDYSAYVVAKLNPITVWDTVTGGAQGVVELSAGVDPRSGAVDVRAFNDTDKETVIERTGFTGNTRDISIGPTEYEPATTASPFGLRIDFRNQDNSSTVGLTRATLTFGVQL